MELYIQVGYGMMGLCKELFQEWRGGTAILSPRDLKPHQLVRLSAELRELDGSVLLDPQFYLPRADHHRLTSHEYWPKAYDTAGFAEGGANEMLRVLAALNRELQTTHLIVPGERADPVNDLWLESQRALLEVASASSDQPLIATICLSSEAVRSSDQIGLVIEQAESTPVSGYYLVLEHPGFNYLVDDPQWLANALDLTAGLRRLRANVIVGYSNQQQLIMACAGASAIASGTWMNVRSFLPGKFRSTYEEDVKRRAVWYYCPQTLSEYTLPFLDIGFRLGFTTDLYPDPSTPFAEPLFSVPQPSASGWGEPEAFRHYLDALFRQVHNSTYVGFDETVDAHKAMLERASRLLEKLWESGIRGQARDFHNALDASQAALVLMEKTHGPLLRRRWMGVIGPPLD